MKENDIKVEVRELLQYAFKGARWLGFRVSLVVIFGLIFTFAEGPPEARITVVVMLVLVILAILVLRHGRKSETDRHIR